MYLHKSNLDGSNPQVSTMQDYASLQGYVNATVAASEESPGFLCICGSAFNSEYPTEHIMNVVAISGTLVKQNLTSGGHG